MTKKQPDHPLYNPKATGEELPSSDHLQELFGIEDDALLVQRVNEITGLLWVPENASQETKEERTVRALKQFEGLKPADGAESMLAIQMVATHDAALESLRRAALPNQSPAGRDVSLKHAHKLMTLYAQQLATLDKHRGKGQQKVTVEHVNVEAGGQAIVGHVEGRNDGPSPAVAPAAIEHNPEVPLETSTTRKKQPARKR